MLAAKSRSMVTTGSQSKCHSYEGGFEFGLQSGRGTHFFANGDKYEGLFSKGVRNGPGTYRFAGGESIGQALANGVEQN